MKQITINVNDDKYSIFKAFIESLEYAKIVGENDDVKNAKKRRIAGSIKKGLEEVDLIKQGKLKGTNLKDLLNEL